MNIFPAQYYAMAFSMSDWYSYEMKAWLSYIRPYIQFFLDSLKFQVKQENLHPNLTLSKPLTLFRMGFFGPAHGGMGGGGGGQKGPPSLKSVTHILKWWNLAELYLN